MIPFNTLIHLSCLDDKKDYFFILHPHEIFSTHRGIIKHEKIAAETFGSVIYSHKNIPFLILKPSLFDLIMKLKRHTQIIYPKDIGYILLKLGLKNGYKVLEIGTGTGILTITMAHSVLPNGKIFSYDKNAVHLEKAASNIDLVGVSQYINLTLKDIEKEELEIDSLMDAVFLDVKDPIPIINIASQHLENGGMMGLILPTTNQICEVIKALEIQHFSHIEVLELFERHYKINPYRLRPQDRMIAHTAYLVFARKTPFLNQDYC